MSVKFCDFIFIIDFVCGGPQSSNAICDAKKEYIQKSQRREKTTTTAKTHSMYDSVLLDSVWMRGRGKSGLASRFFFAWVVILFLFIVWFSKEMVSFMNCWFGIVCVPIEHISSNSFFPSSSTNTIGYFSFDDVDTGGSKPLNWASATCYYLRIHAA